MFLHREAQLLSASHYREIVVKNLIYIGMFFLLFYFIIIIIIIIIAVLHSCNMGCSFQVTDKRGLHFYFFIIVILESPRSCLAK